MFPSIILVSVVLVNLLAIYLFDLIFLFCRLPIIDKFKDMGTVVMGKVESGSVREGDGLLIMPNKVLLWALIYNLNLSCIYSSL